MATEDLVNLSSALVNAVVHGRFMSSEHAKNVWLNYLRDNGFDASKIVSKKRVEIGKEK